MITRTSMREAVSLGLEELRRTLELLCSLQDEDWAKPTDCAGWSVHDVVAHLVGQFEGAARPDRLLRRVHAARRMPGFSVLDGHNELQVRQRKGLTHHQLVEELEGWGAGDLQAVRLVLDGPAGGEWVVGQGVPNTDVRCDAIAYCRHASGRPATQAKVTGQREVGEALLAVKISF